MKMINTEELAALEVVMENVDPATWPGLAVAQRAALSRFAKPQDRTYVWPPFGDVQKWALENGYSGATDDEAYRAYQMAHPLAERWYINLYADEPYRCASAEEAAKRRQYMSEGVTVEVTLSGTCDRMFFSTKPVERFAPPADECGD